MWSHEQLWRSLTKMLNLCNSWFAQDLLSPGRCTNVSEWVSEWVCEWVGEWVSEWVSEWVDHNTGSWIWSISTAPSYVKWKKTLCASTAAGPRCLYPNIKSIQWWRFYEDWVIREWVIGCPLRKWIDHRVHSHHSAVKKKKSNGENFTNLGDIFWFESFTIDSNEIFRSFCPWRQYHITNRLPRALLHTQIESAENTNHFFFRQPFSSAINKKQSWQAPTLILTRASIKINESHPLELRRNSGIQKNSGMSSLTSAGLLRQPSQVAGIESNMRSAWSKWPSCKAMACVVNGSMRIR